MKKRIAWIVLFALLTVSLLPLTALAADVSPADGYNDHDYSVLRAYLETEVGGTKNGFRVRTSYNADDPTTWEVSWAEFGGEKYAYGINWNDKGLTGTLDLSGFVHLSALYVDANSLSSIVTTGCTDLSNFTCESNGLTSLDLSTNTSLGWLDCRYNQLTSLDTSKAGASLYYLWCEENKLSTLTVTGNTKLSELYCYNNKLSTLNLSGFDALVYLSCDDNLLTSLNVTGCVSLKELYCYKNQLTELDASTNTALTKLDCGANSLTSLNVSGLKLLEDLNCSENQLTGINLTGLTALTDLECGKNRISSLNYSDCPLVYLDCNSNLLTSLDLSGLAGLMYLDCSNNALGSLDVSHNTLLDSLGCDNCGLTSLDVSKNTVLRSLSLSGNGISALSLSGLTKLMMLDCSGNKLTTLSASGDLYMIDATGNPLVSIAAVINGNAVALAAEGDGYVGLYCDWKTYYAEATPETGTDHAFCNWTNASDAEVSTTAKMTLLSGSSYDLTANFMTLASSDADASIFTGGRVTLTPSVAGGTWTFDSAYFSREGDTFTALKAGSSAITYTVGGASVSYQVTITKSNLPSTGQDMTWVWVLAGAALAVCAAAGVWTRRRVSARAK